MDKDVILTPEQIAAEERRWLFDAPIAELAEVKGVTVDEAVKLRTDAILQEAAVPIEVTVRPIEPQGKLIGFASVNYGGVVIDDFKVVDGKNGIFLGAPSKPDPTSRTGYRSTVRINDRATQERLNAAGVQAYPYFKFSRQCILDWQTIIPVFFKFINRSVLKGVDKRTPIVSQVVKNLRKVLICRTIRFNVNAPASGKTISQRRGYYTSICDEPHGTAVEFLRTI